jgi:hypothetical protein
MVDGISPRSRRWSHARRKLVDLEDVDCRVAYPLKLIARLYRIEHLANARGSRPLIGRYFVSSDQHRFWRN